MAKGNDPAMSAKRFRVFAILAALVYAGLAVLSLLPATMSFMMFDAPGSTENPYTLAAFFGILSVPLDLLVCAIVIGLAAIMIWRRAAMVAFLIPFLHLAYIVGAFVMLQVMCGGRFACG